MDRPPTPEFAFRLGAEAMRTKAAAWAMTRGLTPVAIDLLNMDVPAFSLPDTMTLERHERDSGIVEFRDDRPPPEYTPNPPLVWDEGKKA